jgi:lysylphosphatidylglycerol synthetase-like protein (DUF2156 family)
MTAEAPAPEGASDPAPLAEDTPARRADDTASPSRTPVQVEVPLGRRVMVLGDLLLAPEATPSSTAVARDLAQTLDSWEGPGLVVICGNLFGSFGGAGTPFAEHVRDALRAHDPLTDAVRRFTARPDSRLLVLPGWRDPELGTDTGAARAVGALGMSIVPAADLRLQTAGGLTTVLVRPGIPATGVPEAGATDRIDERPWLDGVTKLEDPATSGRFVTSRVLYRRMGRLFGLVALLPALAVCLLRLPAVFGWLNRLIGGSPGPHRALVHAYAADWTDRLLVAAGGAVVVALVLALVVALASRAAWTALGQGHLPPPWPHPRARRSAALTGSLGDGGPLGYPGSDGHAGSEGHPGLLIGARHAVDVARAAVAAGATGVITGGGVQAALTDLDPGFHGSPGASAELVREYPGRAGLPPVFLHHRQSSWIELETGAQLHVRLLLAEGDVPSATLLERLAVAAHPGAGHRGSQPLHPGLVASWPKGATWPPVPDRAPDRRRIRRVRRMAAIAIFVAGLVDLLEAVTPPLRGHLRLVEPFLPLGLAQAAGALVALAGIGLMMLARGVRRGQRRSWFVSVIVLATTLALHLAHDTAVPGLVLSGAVLALLLFERRHFGATTDTTSSRSAVITLLVGAAVAITAATVAVEVNGVLHHRTLPAWPMVIVATAERLVGLRTVALPDAADDWISPGLLAVGIALAVVVLGLLTRPVVDRRLSTGGAAARRIAEGRARDIVRRHQGGTLDYFALRDDKQWFFSRDSVVAYAVYGGVCLVSPDPIGPVNERAHVWEAFRRFADRHSWTVGVMAASEHWLPHYRDSGMRHVYIGDEAVVDVGAFSLEGGKMKGLRQAITRVRRNGYTVSFVDPARLEGPAAAELIELMGRNRRGEQERGFSMTLGRVFEPHDTGLLMTVVTGPDSAPVAVCQFVPAPAIGGYSLDLMRRDPGEHPNGLLDFALVSTIEHLREQGHRALSLNFATLRSLLDGEGGDGLTQRVERWALRRLSGTLQIESLWRFNAKYEPDWLPRYIVWDSAEHFVPTLVQILRAESLTDIPVVGRLLAPTAPRSVAS